MRIVIDNGHGGTDPGALSKSGMKESKVNLNVANFLIEMLKMIGYQTTMTNPKDQKMELKDRVKMAVEFKADLLISIHHNAGGGDGSEVIYEIGDEKSKELAELVNKEFTKLNNSRGLKTHPSAKNPKKNGLAMLNVPNCVCIITEFAFMDTKDVESIDTLTEQKAEAKAIFDAIQKYEKRRKE